MMEFVPGNYAGKRADGDLLPVGDALPHPRFGVQVLEQKQAGLANGREFFHECGQRPLIEASLGT